MKIELSDEERQQMLECINTTIRSAPNAINASALLLPIVAKLTPKSTDHADQVEVNEAK